MTIDLWIRNDEGICSLELSINDDVIYGHSHRISGGAPYLSYIVPDGPWCKINETRTVATIKNPLLALIAFEFTLTIGCRLVMASALVVCLDSWVESGLGKYAFTTLGFATVLPIERKDLQRYQNLSHPHPRSEL